MFSQIHSHRKLMQSVIFFLVIATFQVARLTLQSRTLWLVDVASDRNACVTLACVSFHFICFCFFLLSFLFIIFFPVFLCWPKKIKKIYLKKKTPKNEKRTTSKNIKKTKKSIKKQIEKSTKQIQNIEN